MTEKNQDRHGVGGAGQVNDVDWAALYDRCLARFADERQRAARLSDRALVDRLFAQAPAWEHRAAFDRTIARLNAMMEEVSRRRLVGLAFARRFPRFLARLAFLLHGGWMNDR